MIVKSVYLIFILSLIFIFLIDGNSVDQWYEEEEETSLTTVSTSPTLLTPSPSSTNSQECVVVNDQQQKRIDELERRIKELERLVSNRSGKRQWMDVQKHLTQAALTLGSVKNWIVSKAPPTDDLCYFDWKSLSCAPNCFCTWNAQLGDYSLDRACRMKSKHEIAPGCIGHHPEATIVNKAIDHALLIVSNHTSAVMDIINAHSPPTDVECRWNWKKMRCSPKMFCALDFQWGDYSLNRACRFRTDYED